MHDPPPTTPPTNPAWSPAASVDVVIPAYNGAHTLPESVESVLTQKPAPARVIVVDDASTDDTTSALAAYAGRIEQVRHGENRGAGGARNTGLQLATAPLVAFLDCNDTWEPGLLACHLEAFAEHPTLGLHFTSLWNCDESLQPIGPPRTVPDRHGVQLFQEAFLDGFAIPPSVLCVRREAVAVSGGFDPAMRVAEDLDFALRLLMLFPASSTSTPYARRRRHADSLTLITGAQEHIRAEIRLWRNIEAAAQRHGVVLPMSAEERTRRTQRLRLRDFTLYGAAEVADAYWRALQDSGGGGPVDVARRLQWRLQRLARRAARRPGA